MALTNRVEINIANNAKLCANTQYILAIIYTTRPKNMSLIYKGTFGCNLEASDSVQNRVDLELQSDSEANVRLNFSLT